MLHELRGLPISWSTEVEGVREALRAFGPALAGRGVVQLSSYLDLVLASLLAVGAVSALGYAQLLYLLPVSLFGQSLAAATLPELARASGREPEEALARRARSALARAGFLNLPTAVAYLTCGTVIVGALYGLLPGRFGAAETALVAAVLAGYALGLPAATGSRVLQSSFFALGDTRTPARVAGYRVALGAGLAVPLMLLLDRWRLSDLPWAGGRGGELRMGGVGLALAASAAAWLEWGWLSRALAKRLPRPGWERSEALRVTAASLVGGAAGLGVQLALAGQEWPALAVLAAVMGAFGGTFLACGLALRLPYLSRVPFSGRTEGE